MPVLTKNTDDLILGARQKSNTVFNQVVKDDEIVNRLSEALSELDGFLTASNEHYRFSSTTFTLQNCDANDGLNIADLPTDFYKEISLDRKNIGGNLNETVTRFNIMERNRTSNRRFEILGDKIQVNPSQIAGGDYVFRYIATPPILRAPEAVAVVTTSPADRIVAGRTFAATNADTVVSSTNQWTLFNGAFTADDVGALLSFTGAVNAVNNGVHEITSVISATVVRTNGLTASETLSNVMNAAVTSSPTSTRPLLTLRNARFTTDNEGLDVIISGCDFADNNGVFTVDEVLGPNQCYLSSTAQMLSETFDSLVSVDVQTPGTIWKLPQIYMPWYEYLESRAARDILQKREQDTSAVDQKIAMLIQRIQSLAAIRTEDGGQVPMADTFGNWWYNNDWLGFSN